ncbi:cation diffusion facilitator family transporter [Hwanghaeella sp.]|uniref:cation diffusion facilitator family transporter n=1 Tax=Hwanghaeella sp. TaxID=2605943 RepID=UPI003CCBC0DC
MAAQGSKLVIYAALAGNGLIAITKFAAAGYTGSSAMFSEAIHSVVDTGNQGLLLYGLHRANRPPDQKHPFGYGGEVYFWSFVVAILLFAVGSGFSLYEGVLKVMDPHPVTNVFVSYLVLGGAIVFEAGAWIVAAREFNKTRKGRPILRTVLEAKDPSIITVLLEDSAAMLGLIAALVGIWLGQVTGNPVYDGAASIVIGVILAMAAIFLAIETKGLLIGEAAHPEVTAALEGIIADQASVAQINEILTMHVGPSDVLVNASLDFKDSVDSVEIERAVTEIEAKIKQAYPRVTRIFIEAQNWQEHERTI